MIVYVSEEWVGDATVLVGVSSKWSVAVKRIMEQYSEHYSEHTHYPKVNKLSDTQWDVRLKGRGLVGYITKVEMDKAIALPPSE